MKTKLLLAAIFVANTNLAYCQGITSRKIPTSEERRRGAPEMGTPEWNRQMAELQKKADALSKIPRYDVIKELQEIKGDGEMAAQSILEAIKSAKRDDIAKYCKELSSVGYISIVTHLLPYSLDNEGQCAATALGEIKGKTSAEALLLYWPFLDSIPAGGTESLGQRMLTKRIYLESLSAITNLKPDPNLPDEEKIKLFQFAATKMTK